jgi:hypothetical protein
MRRVRAFVINSNGRVTRLTRPGFCTAASERVYGDYVDFGNSGTNEKRPELDRLLVEVTSGGSIGLRVLFFTCCGLWRTSRPSALSSLVCSW